MSHGINEIIIDGSNGAPPSQTRKESNKNIYFFVGSAAVGVIALVIMVVAFVNFSKRRSEKRILNNLLRSGGNNEYIFGLEAEEEEQGDAEEEERYDENEAEYDGMSRFDPSTIQTEKTSRFRQRMENILLQEAKDGSASLAYPQSVFNASTIKSEGSWIHHSVLPTTMKNKQSSALDIDFFEDNKAIPDHIMCFESKIIEETLL
jgi:hypothetical protein